MKNWNIRGMDERLCWDPDGEEIGRGFAGFLSEEGGREGVGATACDGAFAEKVFKEADDEDFEIHGRINAGASATRNVGAGGLADFTDACGENDGIDIVLKLARVENERMNFRFPTGC